MSLFLLKTKRNPTQFIVVAAGFLLKVQDKKNLGGEGWMEGEALAYVWVLRALVLCKLSGTQPERQKRDLKHSKVLGLVGENLDLLWVPNFIPVLEIVHKANENH